MTIRGRTILRPKRRALAPIAIETPTITVIRAWRLHKSGESPLARMLPVGGQRVRFSIFNRRILPKRALSKQGAKQAKRTNAKKRQPNSHGAHLQEIKYIARASFECSLVLPLQHIVIFEKRESVDIESASFLTV